MRASSSACRFRALTNFVVNQDMWGNFHIDDRCWVAHDFIMSEATDHTLEHASCVAIDGAGVLIKGASGAGKSDLALRLIDGGAVLIADDYVEISHAGGALVARPPDRIAGRMEVRGLGLTEMPYEPDVEVRLVIELVTQSDEERLPDDKTSTFGNVDIPLCRLWGFAASAPAKVRLALREAQTS